MESQRNRIPSLQSESNASDNLPSFLLKTYEILENQKYNDIISWTRNGEGFIVKKVKDLSQNILPIYFRHSNYTSFVRQLNMYDFHKTRQENHQNSFKNTLFKRGAKHLLKEIQRKDYKKNKDNKDGSSQRQNAMQKSKDSSKNDKSQQLNEISKLSLNKILELNTKLEKKVIFLAEIRQVPSSDVDILKILDCLFDLKIIHKEIVDKLGFFSIKTVEEPNQKLRKSLSNESQYERQCPTTESKLSTFWFDKQYHQPSTNCFLSFSQI